MQHIGVALALLVAACPAAAQGWDRATPGPGPDANPYALWPEDQATRLRGLHQRFCGNLRLAQAGAPFPFADDAACMARQEALLARFCSPEGRSLSRTQSFCFAAVDRDMREGLGRIHAARDAADPRLAPMAQPLPDMPAPQTQFLPPAEIFRRNAPSIWLVRVASGIAGRSGSQGSAVAVSARHLLTNCHVVRRGAEITVHHRRVEHRARIVAMDLEGDRCILQTDADALRPISGMRPFGDLTVGERSYAIGAPAGLELTLSEGLVSARRVTPSGPVVQSTTPITNGSSGGGLFDGRGNLIGITTFGVGRNGNLNFSIPADHFWSVPLARAAPPAAPVAAAPAVTKPTTARGGIGANPAAEPSGPSE